jgi:hypothetical protein
VSARHREKLQARQLKTTSFLGRVAVHWVERDTITRFDPAGPSCPNLKAPDELQGAQAEH